MSLRSKSRDVSPGSIHPRINYGLHERVVRVDVNEKAHETKQLLAEERRQEMYQQKWNDSVYVSPCKHSHAASDMTLSNTLMPSDINPHDLRHTRSSFARASEATSPAQRQTDAGSTVRASRHTSGGWNPSTSYSSKEISDRSRQLLGSSLGATRARATKLIQSKGHNHPSLVEQQTTFTEAVRQHKALNGVDTQDLVQMYGEEGAAAMQQILAMPSLSPSQKRGSRRPAPREDVEAVLNLPDEVPGALSPSPQKEATASEE